VLFIFGVKMGYKDLTIRHFSEYGQVYSLTRVTEKRTPYFNDFAVARSLTNEMRKMDNSGQLESLAWVIMWVSCTGYGCLKVIICQA
jgi:hypothetical protein